jgi:hypothetical protein
MGGGPSQATKDQQQVQLQSSQQQMKFENQLMGIFQKQFASQQNVLKYLQGTLKPIVNQAEKGQGMSTATLNAEKAQAVDSVASNTQQAQQALNATMAGQMGGTNVTPSGVRGQLDAALMNAGAQSKEQALQNIQFQNQNLANSNLWNSINAIQGNSAQMNPLGYAGASTGAAGAVASGSGAQGYLQNSITQANSSSFMGQLGSSLARGVGGGLNSAMGALPGVGQFFG